MLLHRKCESMGPPAHRREDSSWIQSLSRVAPIDALGRAPCNRASLPIIGHGNVADLRHRPARADDGGRLLHPGVCALPRRARRGNGDRRLHDRRHRDPAALLRHPQRAYRAAGHVGRDLHRDVVPHLAPGRTLLRGGPLADDRPARTQHRRTLQPGLRLVRDRACRDGRDGRHGARGERIREAPRRRPRGLVRREPARSLPRDLHPALPGEQRAPAGHHRNCTPRTRNSRSPATWRWRPCARSRDSSRT
jgi:hypothetical protein